ncbi:MAG: hypothetical protein AAF560_25310 [Acidobacteriota bacterium]
MKIKLMKLNRLWLVGLALACLATLSAGSLTAEPSPGTEADSATAEPADKAVVISIAKLCAHSIEDQSTNVCIQASKAAQLGRLYPITEDLFVAPSGEVGIGTTQPGEQLSVDGTIHSTSGGFRFPNGSVQSTARAVGDPGPPGPTGPQGPAGPPGNPGSDGVIPINGLFGPFVNLVGSGGTTVSTSGNTVTVTTPNVPCTYRDTTYSTNDNCYTERDFNPCPAGSGRQVRLRCLADGSWQVITSSACNNPALLPFCGN